jgi:hypothetical protein
MPGMISHNARVKDVSTGRGLLTVWLDDGRILSLPLAWYPSLKESSAAERSIWRKCGGGRGIHWPAIDYDLDVEGLLKGARERPSILEFTRRYRTRKRRARAGSSVGRGAGPRLATP